MEYKNDCQKNREVYFSSILPSIHEISVFCEQPANPKKDSYAYFYIRKWIDAAKFITGQFMTGNRIDESQVLQSIEYYRNDIMYINELKKGISLLNNAFNKLIKNKEAFFAVMSDFTDSEKDKLYDVCNNMNSDMENATKWENFGKAYVLELLENDYSKSSVYWWSVGNVQSTGYGISADAYYSWCHV